MNQELSGYTLRCDTEWQDFDGTQFSEGDEYATVVNHWPETGTIELRKPHADEIQVTNDMLVQEKFDDGLISIA